MLDVLGNICLRFPVASVITKCDLHFFLSRKHPTNEQ